MKLPVYRAGEAPNRAYSIERKTKETQIAVNLCLDGGEVRVSTGIGFFDHMLTALAFYAGFGLELEAAGDLEVDGHGGGHRHRPGPGFEPCPWGPEGHPPVRLRLHPHGRGPVLRGPGLLQPAVPGL